ncbi:MAG: CoA ester lyase [Oscillospiraceae bacterium]|nr:CoA ester lyase [Oscillospiraceae bacterium]
MAVRRSDLYLPANNEHMIQKAPSLGADVITLDLEDSVPLAEKAKARELVRKNIGLMSTTGSEAWVRVNAWDTDLTLADLDAVVLEGLDGITLPKCSGLADVRRLDDEITRLEKLRGLPVGRIKIAILVETALGVLTVDEAVGGSPRLVAVIFGAVDYTRDMRVTRTDRADEQYYARAKIGVAARAHGLIAEDAPFPNYSDVEAFRANCISGAQLGFEGRQIINPRQIAVAHEVYSPAPERVEWAKEITKVFEEEGLAKGSASVGYKGSMIDIPVYHDGLNILARQQEIEEKEANRKKI